MARIVLTNSVALVVDEARSIPPEFDGLGVMIRGGVATKPLPPWTPFEVNEDEAARILAVRPGIEIPADVDDVDAWIAARRAERRLRVAPAGA